MACGGCRSRGAYAPSRAVAPAGSRQPSPCDHLDQAGDATLVEVQRDGTLVPRTPYASPGYGLLRTLAVLGCRSHKLDTWPELELAVKAALASPTSASRFWAKVTTPLVTLGSVKAALVYAHAQ